MPGDAVAVGGVYAAGWRAVFGHLLGQDRVPESVLAGWGRGSVHAPWCLVAERAGGGPVVGFACGDPGSGLLERLFVHPDHAGAGGVLLDAAGPVLAAGGARPRVWVWHADAAAVDRCARHGWVASGRERPNWVGGVMFVYAEMVRHTPDPR